jgi:hypothetical protein
MASYVYKTQEKVMGIWRLCEIMEENLVSMINDFTGKTKRDERKKNYYEAQISVLTREVYTTRQEVEKQKALLADSEAKRRLLKYKIEEYQKELLKYRDPS